MPSPFPGMDPWLERPGIFPDFHDSLIVSMRTAINATLPPPYFAAIANRIWIEGAERYVEPDVDVLHPSRTNGNATEPSGSSGIAVAEARQAKPIIVHMPREESTERFLEIHAAPDGEQLVTTIEVLSLANKRRGSIGRREYLKEQREILDSDVNLVEIDLLRGGTHTTAVSFDRALKKTGAFDYHVCVRRFEKPEDYEIYPIRSPQMLPIVAIPLLPGAADIDVSLQELLAQCYDAGLYSRRVRYLEHQPEPPLTETQAKWAEQILREKGIVPGA
jgi:hypothetical protein